MSAERPEPESAPDVPAPGAPEPAPAALEPPAPPVPGAPLPPPPEPPVPLAGLVPPGVPATATVNWAAGVPRRGRQVPGVPGYVFAGAQVRVAAYWIDSIIAGIIAAIVSGVFGVVFGSGATGSVGNPFLYRPTAIDVLVQYLVLAIELAYFVGFWARGRGSPGMRILDIQVAHRDGGRNLTLTEAFVRYLWLFTPLVFVGPLITLLGPELWWLYAVSGLSLVWQAGLLVTTVRDPNRVGFHDHQVGSWLVQPEDRTHDGVGQACTVVIGLIVVLLAVSLAFAISILDRLDGILSQIGQSI